MQRWTDLSHIPDGFGPSVVTIGNFDGVHRGHQEVLRRVVATAREHGILAVAVTFYPHPAVIHRQESAPDLITGLDDRLELMARTGIDAVLVVEYTAQFAEQTAAEFVRKYLVSALGAASVVVGHDVRFGVGNSGNLGTMAELGQRFGFTVIPIDDVGFLIEANQETPGVRHWSSTVIRELLGQGRVREAAEILGRCHRVRGTVVHGDARGRELGFPTANLGQSSGMVPADGVYAGWLTRPGLPDSDADHCLPAAISVGTNPTFDGIERRVEAYVLDRSDLDLYEEEVLVTFNDRLRDTVRFDSVSALIAQMQQDVQQARALLQPGS